MRFVTSVMLVLFLAATSLAASIDTAMNHFAKNDFAAAIHELESYVADNPSDTHGLFLLGYAYYKSGKMDKAMEQFKSAYLVDPNFIPPVPATSGKQ